MYIYIYVYIYMYVYIYIYVIYCDILGIKYTDTKSCDTTNKQIIISTLLDFMI